MNEGSRSILKVKVETAAAPIGDEEKFDSIAANATSAWTGLFIGTTYKVTIWIAAESGGNITLQAANVTMLAAAGVIKYDEITGNLVANDTSINVILFDQSVCELEVRFAFLLRLRGSFSS